MANKIFYQEDCNLTYWMVKKLQLLDTEARDMHML